MPLASRGRANDVGKSHPLNEPLLAKKIMYIVYICVQ